jgi:synaptotagmin-1
MIQVQPDEQGLTANMEEQAEDRESTKSDVKLGRLQFRIDYDFNQSNVSQCRVHVSYFQSV